MHFFVINEAISIDRVVMSPVRLGCSLLEVDDLSSQAFQPKRYIV